MVRTLYRRVSLYWWVLLALSIAVGGWGYHKKAQQYAACIDGYSATCDICKDGHCPDPGGREWQAGFDEYRSWVQRSYDQAPATAALVSLMVFVAGIFARALFILLRWVSTKVPQ